MAHGIRFTDSRGLTWNAYELPASRIEFDDRVVDETPAHLTFELVEGREPVLRRLLRYPADWATLPVAELESLIDAAGDAPLTHASQLSTDVRRHLRELST